MTMVWSTRPCRGLLVVVVFNRLYSTFDTTTQPFSLFVNEGAAMFPNADCVEFLRSHGTFIRKFCVFACQSSKNRHQEDPFVGKQFRGGIRGT